mgnify:CR=1 FL=1
MALTTILKDYARTEHYVVTRKNNADAIQIYRKEDMKPIRIQRKRTKGWKMPENTIYVGRPSKWGNPFLVGVAHLDDKNKWIPRSKIEAYLCFKEWFNRLWINRMNNLMESKYPIKELKYKNLCCWCRLNQPCHADVLLEIANK